jgi:dTDP-4-amino-4,6-dideoxygalactose transaminase
MERFFGNRRVTLYASGTAALAHAIANCRARRRIGTPEVIIPAYGCPDLVAACEHASVYPRLVDTLPSQWSYDPVALHSALSANTIAILAVNLLGIGDGSAELSRLCRDKGIGLIQDSAQYLPRQQADWPGDYVILSFGRGKPLNLLHGGALVGPSTAPESIADSQARDTARHRLLDTRAAAIAFNFLTRPVPYRIISSLPQSGLGAVVYKPLGNSDPLPERNWSRVAHAFGLYRRAPSYRRDLWVSALEEWSDLGIVPLTSPGAPPQAEPLRLALLAPDRATRDTIVTDCDRKGLGASRLYGTDLTRVSKIPEVVQRQGPFPNASALADRLFTLPTHTLVQADTVRKTRDVVMALSRSRGAQYTHPNATMP